MELQDTSPERRNLNLFAILAITYSIGGASFVDGQVKLALINAQFTNVGYLAILFILGFFWVTFRYWVSHRDAFTNARNISLHKWRPKSGSNIEKRLMSTKVGRNENRKIIQVIGLEFRAYSQSSYDSKCPTINQLNDIHVAKKLELTYLQRRYLNFIALINSPDMTAITGTFVFSLVGWGCVFFEVYQYCNQ